MADYSEAKQEYDRMTRREHGGMAWTDIGGSGGAMNVQPMPDPYKEGRGVRRAKIFERAAEMRYNDVKYQYQSTWEDLSDASRQLWIDVVYEVYEALRQATTEERYTMLEFFLDGETP